MSDNTERCETCPNAEKMLVIRKGDDSDFPLNVDLFIDMSSDYDLSGCSAHFKLYDYVQDFDKIPENGLLYVTFPASVSKDFPVGLAYGTLWIEAKDGKRCTINRKMLVKVEL